MQRQRGQHVAVGRGPVVATAGDDRGWQAGDAAFCQDSAQVGASEVIRAHRLQMARAILDKPAGAT